jgi:hypothetical protein
MPGDPTPQMELMRMTMQNVKPIELSVTGCDHTTVRATPAALEPGGVQIEIVTFAGTPIETRDIVSLTAAEAEVLVGQITLVVRGVTRPDTQAGDAILPGRP